MSKLATLVTFTLLSAVSGFRSTQLTNGVRDRSSTTTNIHGFEENRGLQSTLLPAGNTKSVRERRSYPNSCLQCPIEIKTDSNNNLALPLLALLLSNYLTSYQSLAASCTLTQTATVFSTTTVAQATTLTSLTTTTVTVASTQTSTSTDTTTVVQTLTSNIFSSLTVFSTFFVTVTSVSSVTVTTTSTVPANNCPNFKTINVQAILENRLLESSIEISNAISPSSTRILSSIKDP